MWSSRQRIMICCSSNTNLGMCPVCFLPHPPLPANSHLFPSTFLPYNHNPSSWKQGYILIYLPNIHRNYFVSIHLLALQSQSKPLKKRIYLNITSIYILLYIKITLFPSTFLPYNHDPSPWKQGYIMIYLLYICCYIS